MVFMFYSFTQTSNNILKEGYCTEKVDLTEGNTASDNFFVFGKGKMHP